MDDLSDMASAFKRALMQAIPDEVGRLHATTKVDEAVFLAREADTPSPPKKEK